MEIKRQISNDFVFDIPKRIQIVEHREKFIVISPDTATWLVVNKQQLCFFQLLQTGETLGNALAKFNGKLEDAKWVVTQIVAKQFENKNVVRFNSRSLHLYMTNACNLHCPFCYMDAGRRENDELSTEEIKKLFSEFKNRGGVVVTLSGGEVTLRKDLCGIIRFAKEIGLKVNVYTNGVLWTKSMIEEVTPFLDKVQISIDGFNEEENSLVRGKNSFDKSMKTMELFIENQIPVEIACTPYFDDSLKSKINDYVAFGKTLMNKYKGLPFLIKFNGEILDGRDKHFSDEEREQFIEIMEQINSQCHNIQSRDDGMIESLKRNEIKDNCAFGNLNVSSTGDVYFCSLIPTLKPVANIRTDSYEKIFALSEEAKRLSNVDNLVPCRDCELKYICGGDCRIHHFEGMKSGVIDKQQAYRKCDKKQKEIFYDTLIRINERLFQ